MLTRDLCFCSSRAGIAFMGWFFVYETTVTKSKRSLFKELFLATVASGLLGFGGLFLLLWAGVWV
jgi:hypothetical protein